MKLNSGILTFVVKSLKYFLKSIFVKQNQAYSYLESDALETIYPVIRVKIFAPLRLLDTMNFIVEDFLIIYDGLYLSNSLILP